MINLKEKHFYQFFFIDFYIFITKNKKPKQPPTPHKLHLCLLVKKKRKAAAVKVLIVSAH